MLLDKIEVWVHDNLLKNNTIRHFLYGIYQRSLVLMSKKIKNEGSIVRVSPQDESEYLFGYYDKCPWSPDGKYMLALKVANSYKKADSSDLAQIVRINLSTKEAENLSTTHSWNVQQGCMLQWLDNDNIIYNDYFNNRYCSVLLNTNNQEKRIFEAPIYSLSKKTDFALTLDFGRLHILRPGYGYMNFIQDIEPCPDSPCIWHLDIQTGEVKSILKYTDFCNFETRDNMIGATHKVNHIMISPNGKRFMVIHRWFVNGTKYSRLVTCNVDGTDMYNLSDDDFVSHCYWVDDENIVAYLKKCEGKGYYMLTDKRPEYKKVWPELVMDGHPSRSNAGVFVTDTYPDRQRLQSVYVMNEDNVRRVARLYSPFRYGGDVRCDLHPRWSRDGKEICVDASFEGKRELYIIKV